MIFYDFSSAWLNSQRLIESDPDGLQTPQIYAFADGSAALIKGQNFNAPFVERTFTTRDGTGFTTVNGLAGRDR